LVFSRPDLRDRAARLGDRSGPIDGDEMRTFLVGIGGRVAAVGRLHRLLAESPAESTVNLGEYLQEISAAIVAALAGDGGMQLRFDCDPHCVVPTERALSIGFIVVELVTNAVKHAHPTGVAGEIRVECLQGPDGAITVEVSDDGVGLPEGMDPTKADTLGLRRVRTLSAQLGAWIGFQHSALGLSCVLRMPGELRA
jgi:two-component sensor histidine kinase